MDKQGYPLIVGLLLAALLFSACEVTPPVGDSRIDATMDLGPVTLDMNLGTEPPSLDPALATDAVSHLLIDELFLGLTELDPETRKAMPELATEWAVSADNKVWTFMLRQDVPWVTLNKEAGQVEQVKDANGNVLVVNAHDVVYGVKRTCDANTASGYAYILYIIAGCEAVNTADVTATNYQELLNAVGVKALDDFTVQFTLNYGAGYFGQIVGLWPARPLAQWLIEAAGDTWTEPDTLQSNGPYLLSAWVHNDSLQLVRNPFWYGWHALADVVGNIEVINMTMIKEPSTAFAMYENNELDTVDVPLDQRERVSDPNGEFAGQNKNTPINCTLYLGFVTQRPAVSDVRVRRALSMTVDRQTLTKTILKGGEIPANSFTNPLNFGSAAGDPDIAPWALNIEAGGIGYAAAMEMAQELMAEAGHADGADLSLVFGQPISEDVAKLNQALVAMWKVVFPDIKITFDMQDWGVYLQTLDRSAPLENKPDLYGLGWCADYPHANNWVHEVFNPSQGENRPLLSTDDPQVGDLVAKFDATTVAAQTTMPEEQLKLYKQAEKLLVDDIAAIIPLAYGARTIVVKPWLNRPYSDSFYLYRWSIDAKAKTAAR